MAFAGEATAAGTEGHSGHTVSPVRKKGAMDDSAQLFVLFIHIQNLNNIYMEAGE